ncbi:hypothetical protein R2225_003389 [Cronobacter sakazakii]|nr:hypothetical protein [Cronobacter sakazakii]
MTLDNSKFFVINFKPDGEGLPHYIDKEYTPELPTFNIHDGLPKLNEFRNRYTLKTTVDNLAGDYYPLDDLASDEMLSLCSELNVQYFNVPLKIELSHRIGLSKNYNLFYLKKYISIIDKDKSEYEIDDFITDDEKIYFSKIDRFVVKEGVNDHLFFCPDIGKPVCSLDFKERFTKQGFVGIDFIAIDSNYKYDEWDN